MRQVRSGLWASLPTVCNAGRGLLGPLEEHSEDDVGSVLDVNVVGTVRMLQAFLPDMKRRRSGRILVTGSMGGLMGEWKGPGAGKMGPGLPGRGGLSKDLLPCTSQQPHLPSKGCLSMLFTALASSPSKVYARVWRFCCCPLESSESLSCPWNPLNSDFGTPPNSRAPTPAFPILLELLSGILPGPSLVPLTFVVFQAPYWARGFCAT